MHFDALVFIFIVLCKSKEWVIWEHILDSIREVTIITDDKNQQILFLEREDLRDIAIVTSILIMLQEYIQIMPSILN